MRARRLGLMRELSWALNLHDNEGDRYADGLYLFIDDMTILRFDDSTELEQFAHRILFMLSEIRQNEGV